jgi:hypothetical protein
MNRLHCVVGSLHPHATMNPVVKSSPKINHPLVLQEISFPYTSIPDSMSYEFNPATGRKRLQMIAFSEDKGDRLQASVQTHNNLSKK